MWSVERSMAMERMSLFSSTLGEKKRGKGSLLKRSFSVAYHRAAFHEALGRG